MDRVSRARDSGPRATTHLDALGLRRSKAGKCSCQARRSTGGGRSRRLLIDAARRSPWKQPTDIRLSFGTRAAHLGSPSAGRNSPLEVSIIMRVRSSAVVAFFAVTASLATLACSSAPDEVVVAKSESSLDPAKKKAGLTPIASCGTVQATDLLCTASPLGNERAECEYFGLVPAGKDDELSGQSVTASQDAYVAIVKSGSGGCGPGNSAYRVYVNVSAGDSLGSP